jgi:hypothetical protein
LGSIQFSMIDRYRSWGLILFHQGNLIQTTPSASFFLFYLYFCVVCVAGLMFSKVVNGRHMLLFRLPQIYEELYHTVNNADHDKDLKWWSFNHGVNMGMNWPQFEVPLLSFFCLDSKTRKKVISKNPACVFCGRRTNACDTKKSYFVLFFSTTFLDMITYFDFSYFFLPNINERLIR